jgi:hypothetical protein
MGLNLMSWHNPLFPLHTSLGSLRSKMMPTLYSDFKKYFGVFGEVYLLRVT